MKKSAQAWVQEPTRRVNFLSPNHFRKWDLLVENHPLGTIYHLSGWKKVLEESFRHIKGQIIAIWDEHNQEIVGGLPVYFVNSIVTGKRVVSAPFANFCDPLITNAGDGGILSNYLLKIYKQKKPSYVEVKTRQNHSFLKNAQFNTSEHYLHHFIPLTQSPDTLFKQFHKKAIQVPILKALKNDLTLKIAENENDLFLFYQIYLKARKRIGLPAFPYKFFLKLWEVFHHSGRLKLALCMTNGMAIGGSILLKFRDWSFIEFGHDVFEFRKLFVNHFLDWNAVQLAIQEGCNFISFGRTARNNQGLVDYKERWKTQTEKLLTYRHAAASFAAEKDKESSHSYLLIRKICEHSPVVFFKKFSSIVYRHLG
jgi:Acetyltransferase (GNAT) domain